MWKYESWASVLRAIMGQPEPGDVEGARGGGIVGQGEGLRQDVAENSGCDLSDSRKEGVKHEPAGLHGLRYANWRLAGAERGSAELRGTLAQSHRSLRPPLKTTPPPPSLRLPRPSSPPPRYS